MTLRNIPTAARRIAVALAFATLGTLLGETIPACSAQSTEAPAAAHPPEKPAESAIREQTIYIPYEKLRDTLERPGRGVYLPYEQFQQLWNAARNATAKPASPAQDPIPAVITDVRSQATVQENAVQVTAELHVDLLGHGWISIPLGLSNVALSKAQYDNGPARLITDAAGQVSWLLYRPAPDATLSKAQDSETAQGGEPTMERVTLQLEYARAYTKTPGQNVVEFDAPQAAVNRWEFRVPEPDVRVQVHPMLATTDVPANAGTPDENGDNTPILADPTKETVVLAFVGAAKNVRVEWTPKSQGASGLEALVAVQAQQRVTVEEGVIRTDTHLTYDITRAELSTLSVRLPLDEKVVRVIDANIRQWNVTMENDRQLLAIDLFQPVSGQQSIRIESEKYLELVDGGEVPVPVIAAENAGRQRGTVTVVVAEGLRGEPVRREGLVPLDHDVLDVGSTTTQAVDKPVSPPPVPDPSRMMTWSYAALPFQLALRMEKVQPRVSVDHLVEVYLEPERLTVDLFARCHIEEAGIFELEFAIPAGLRVVSVRGDATSGVEAAQVDSFSVTTDPVPRLRVNLSRRAIGMVGLFVELTQDLNLPQLIRPTGESSPFAWELPTIVAPVPHRMATHVVLMSPESLRVNAGTVSELRSVAAAEVYAKMPTLRGDRFPLLSPVLAFIGGERPASLACTAERRQPYVTASQLLVMDVETGVVKFDARFFFDIRYSAVNELRMDVPADLASRLHNDSPTLREAIYDPPPADLPAGYVAWRLTAGNEMLGNTELRLRWETPVENLGIGQSVEIVVPRLIPQNVDRADGQIVLRKSETIDLQPVGLPQGLEPIDPEHDVEHATELGSSAIALEFHDAWQLSIQATRYQLESLKHTSIEQAVVRTVITRSNRLAVQALYRMRTNRQRLVVVLPQDVTADQVQFDNDPLRINGRPVGLEQGKDQRTYHVPLVGTEANKPFLLELRYTIPGDGQRIDFPMFPEEPATQQVHLVAYLPEEQTLLGTQGPWTPKITWLANPWWSRIPAPTINIEQLIASLTTNLSIVSNPSGDFPVDGHPLLFATLRPTDPATDALRLQLINRKVLHAIVILVTLLIGVALLRKSLTYRLAAVCLILVVILLAGMFLPTFQQAIMQGSLAIAIAVVAILWGGIGLLQATESWRNSRRQLPTHSTTPAPTAPHAGSATSEIDPHPFANPPTDTSPPTSGPGQQTSGGDNNA